MIQQNVEEIEANAKHKTESRRNVGAVLDKTIFYVTTNQLTMHDSRRKCHFRQRFASFWTPPDAMKVPSDISQLRSSIRHMNVFCTVLSRPPVTAEVWVWSRSRQCRICTGQSGIRIGLLLLLRISPVSIIPPIPDWHPFISHPPVSIIPPIPDWHPFISHPRCITLATDSVNE